MFRSTSLRLAALYTGAFALAVVALGAITLISTRAALADHFDARIQAEATALTQEYRMEGLDGVLQAVRERDRIPGSLDYGLQGPSGEPLAGRLSVRKAPVGWSTIDVILANSESEPIRLLTAALPGGYLLLVGDDKERTEILDEAVVRGFAWVLFGVILLGALGGYAMHRDVHKRLMAISGTAEAIIDGDLARRVPVRGDNDDLDRLAVTFNRMLDRIASLMDSLRQVSNDIAHDLRTPLTRLRQRLEAGKAAEKTDAAANELIDGALEDLDAALATFAALLRISEIEGGARRAAFRVIDLSVLARTIVDDFSPSAEEAGQSLCLQASEAINIEGDPELLTQMLVNLVENSMRHAGANAKIFVRAAMVDGIPFIAVADDGPGVPEIERKRLFDRFYRLERNRSTPGSGLGLALVAAIARLHEASVELYDANPGLEARVTFTGNETGSKHWDFAISRS